MLQVDFFCLNSEFGEQAGIFNQPEIEKGHVQVDFCAVGRPAGGRSIEKHPVHTRRVFFSKVLKVLKDVSVSITTKVMDYFLLHSFGVTQVPVALATTIGSSRTSAAEALMSGLAAITFLASNFIFLEVLPTLVISP